jgi:putative transcriptional regulator
MTQTKRYHSLALRSLHEAMEDLHGVGAIDKATMRDFDLGCLTPAEPLAPEAIKRIREKARMSQATFALALNVSAINRQQMGTRRSAPERPVPQTSRTCRQEGNRGHTVGALLADGVQRGQAPFHRDDPTRHALRGPNGTTDKFINDINQL